MLQKDLPLACEHGRDNFALMPSSAFTHAELEYFIKTIDWHYNQDRSRIRTGHGPENITRLRRFAVGILKHFHKPTGSLAQIMRRLCFRTRTLCDYLRMTENSRPARQCA